MVPDANDGEYIPSLRDCPKSIKLITTTIAQLNRWARRISIGTKYTAIPVFRSDQTFAFGTFEVPLACVRRHRRVSRCFAFWTSENTVQFWNRLIHRRQAAYQAASRLVSGQANTAAGGSLALIRSKYNALSGLISHRSIFAPWSRRCVQDLAWLQDINAMPRALWND